MNTLLNLQNSLYHTTTEFNIFFHFLFIRKSLDVIFLSTFLSPLSLYVELESVQCLQEPTMQLGVLCRCYPVGYKPDGVRK